MVPELVKPLAMVNAMPPGLATDWSETRSMAPLALLRLMLILLVTLLKVASVPWLVRVPLPLIVAPLRVSDPPDEMLPDTRVAVVPLSSVRLPPATSSWLATREPASV